MRKPKGIFSFILALRTQKFVYLINPLFYKEIIYLYKNILNILIMGQGDIC